MKPYILALAVLTLSGCGALTDPPSQVSADPKPAPAVTMPDNQTLLNGCLDAVDQDYNQAVIRATDSNGMIAIKEQDYLLRFRQVGMEECRLRYKK